MGHPACVHDLAFPLDFWEFRGVDFRFGVGYSTSTFRGSGRRNDLLGVIMEWTAPAFEEVCLNCEINSYASAKL
jgi:coenzyme PQQ precursor peptide PqqA